MPWLCEREQRVQRPAAIPVQPRVTTGRRLLFIVLLAGMAGAARAADAPPDPDRIAWQGQRWYLLGANIPWVDYGRDFGGGTDARGKPHLGVAANRAAIEPGLVRMRDAGVHVARWWTFVADGGWQIRRGADGTPTGLDPAIYADFDAALALADQYDLYYDFVIFGGPAGYPRTWFSDERQRQALVEVLSPLFTRYRDHPRVMTWEPFNEPEWDVRRQHFDATQLVALGKALAGAVHAHSHALVTIGQATAEDMPLWKDAGLDYYSPHWYDPMKSGDACMRSHDAAYYRRTYGIAQPILLGEFFTNAGAEAGARYGDFLAKGYAGAWGWSLFAERTNDRMRVDLEAAKAFVAAHVDEVGPKAAKSAAKTAP
jgi:hypothetical protein